MSAEFVPFLKTMSAKSATAAAPGEFAPIQQNPAQTGTPNHPTATGEVKVELNREGERISQIRIQCRCGEVIDLACEY